MHVVVDRRERRPVGVEIAELGPDPLAIEQRAVALLDGEQADVQTTDERTQVDAGAIEQLVVDERLVLAPQDRRACDDIEPRPRRALPADETAVEPALHTAGIASAGRGGQSGPWPDGGLAVSARPDDIRIDCVVEAAPRCPKRNFDFMNGLLRRR
jgi:hypothetical protein